MSHNLVWQINFGVLGLLGIFWLVELRDRAWLHNNSTIVRACHSRSNTTRITPTQRAAANQRRRGRTVSQLFCRCRLPKC